MVSNLQRTVAFVCVSAFVNRLLMKICLFDRQPDLSLKHGRFLVVRWARAPKPAKMLDWRAFCAFKNK